MKKIVMLTAILLLSSIFILSCKNNSEKKEASEVKKEFVQNKFDLSTQEGYENFLADWGIKIPDNASFKELKKTNDGNYKLIYNIEPFDNMQDSLQSYYENMFDMALLDKGWKKPKEGWDPHGTVYEKGDSYFKFFILVSEKHNIYELAFKYGE